MTLRPRITPSLPFRPSNEETVRFAPLIHLLPPYWTKALAYVDVPFTYLGLASRAGRHGLQPDRLSSRSLVLDLSASATLKAAPPP